MVHKYEDELKQIGEYWQAGLALANAIDVPELMAVKLRMTQKAKQEIAFVNSLRGVSLSGSGTTEPAPHQPVTHMFGVPIVNANKPVKAADSAPTNMEKEKFIKEVDDYYGNFLNLTEEKLFNKSTLPGGMLIIQAVAKKSGYAEWNQPLSQDNISEYIKGVKAAITEKNNSQADLDSAEKKIPAGGKKQKSQNAIG